MESTTARPGSTQPLFSVVIPTFNSAKTILTAIESVLRQPEPHEIWVIDGRSQDATSDLVASVASPVLHWVSEADSGIYDAINKGVQHCRGRLIGVLGSDDRYVPGAFAHLWTAFERDGSDIVAGATRFMGDNGAFTQRVDEAYGYGALISGIPFGHNAMFATPETYRDVGPYDLRYRICADAHWVHRAVRLDKTCSTTPETVVEFGMQGTSSIHAEEIMAETYRVICENFPGMQPDEARTLLFAVRGWGPKDEVPAILARLQRMPLLVQAVDAALPGMEPRGDSSVRSAPAWAGKLGRWLHRLQGR